MNSFKFLVLYVITSCLVIAEDIYIERPSFSTQNILSYNVGIRPYRKSGIRLEPEWFNEELIIHNYGHGGAGLSLSWGSAYEVWDISQEALKNNLSHKKEIAILGCGVIGLCVAHVFLDRGYDVRIYAENFSPETTSNVAAGFFGLFTVTAPEDEIKKNQFDRIVGKSKCMLEELSCAENPAFEGVQEVDFLIFNTKKDEEELEVKAIFNNGIRKECIKRKKIIMKGSTYISDLLQKAQKKGARIISKKFNGLTEILELQENCIINCMGYGARNIFHDNDLIGVRGHTVHIKKPTDWCYLLGNDSNDDSFFVMPWNDRLVLGSRLTQEWDNDIQELDINMCEKILLLAENFFSE